MKTYSFIFENSKLTNKKNSRVNPFTGESIEYFERVPLTSNIIKSIKQVIYDYGFIGPTFNNQALGIHCDGYAFFKPGNPMPTFGIPETNIDMTEGIIPGFGFEISTNELRNEACGVILDLAIAGNLLLQSSIGKDTRTVIEPSEETLNRWPEARRLLSEDELKDWIELVNLSGAERTDLGE